MECKRDVHLVINSSVVVLLSYDVASTGSPRITFSLRVIDADIVRGPIARRRSGTEPWAYNITTNRGCCV